MNPLALLMALLSIGALGRTGSGSDSTTKAAVLKDTPDEEVKIDRGIIEDTPPVVVDDVEPEEDDTPPVVVEEPAPTPPVVVDEPAPTPPAQTGDSDGDGGDTVPVSHGDGLSVMTGRVTTIAPEGDDVASVRIVSGVEHGHVTVNPDNSLALVLSLSDFTGADSFSYEVTHSNGSTSLHDVPLNVVPGAQGDGWGTGADHYMLETDEDDRVIVEHGDNHTKVYISGSDSALSRADIAALKGIDISKVTGQYLAENGFGQSEDMALAEDAGLMLWNTVTYRGSETSNHFLLERGYEYDFGNAKLVMRDSHGEDPLHPLYYGAWGEGDKPELLSRFSFGQEPSNYIVIQDIAFSGGVGVSWSARNVIFDDVTLTQEQMSINKADSITIRNSEFFDIHHEPPAPGEEWESGHVQGLYANYTEGLLLEGNIFDLNGWEPGEGNMEGTIFNHNVYINAWNGDVTVRDTISMRPSSIGMMVRSGGMLEDNVVIDANIGMNTHGGNYKGEGPVAEYTLYADNLVTSAGYNEEAGGALSLGIGDYAQLTTMVDNIITHLADPNNPDEFTEKFWTYDAIQGGSASFYDDTIIWNWAGSRTLKYPENHEKNYEGLDQDVLDQTTIQLFTEALLGKEGATIDDLGVYLRQQAGDGLDDVVDSDLILRFFQEGFGIAPDIRTSAETIRFVPDELADGVRWDNRMNWSTDDLPGFVAGDSVDLGGNTVIFGGNADIKNMETGDGGRVEAWNGRLDVAGEVTTTGAGGALDVNGSAQIWVDGHTGAGLDIDIDAGRFANTGHMRDADLDVQGGEVILGSDGDQWEVGEGHKLAIFDAAAKVGFDGDTGGIAVLDFDEGSTLSFSAENGDLGEIGEFRSGAFGDAPDVLSGIDLEGATLEIDINGLNAAAGNAFTLMSADEIAGIFAEANITGLSGKDATIVVDYKADAVRLELINGTGQTRIETIGGPDDVEAGHDALWAALTADHGVADDSLEIFEEDGDFAIAV